MRATFGKTIADIGEDPKVVLIAGDVGGNMKDEFSSRHPERFFNIGVCEQSMVGIASGLALSGMIPFVLTIKPFLIERAFEQMKMDVDYISANVKLIGYDHTREAGLSHKCLDERKLMSCFRNISVFYPDDAEDMKNTLHEAYSIQGPVYISLK